MEKNRENHRPLSTRLRGLQTLAVLGITAGPSMLAGIEHDRDISARAEAQTVVKECRDSTRCSLGKISLSAERILPQGTRKIDGKTTSEVTINGNKFEVQESEHGLVLKDTDGTQYFMGRLSLKEVLNAVEGLSAQSE